MDKRFFVCIALLILLLNCGIGITAAESSGDNSTTVEETPAEDPVEEVTEDPVDIPAEPGVVFDETPAEDPVDGTPAEEPVVDETPEVETNINVTDESTQIYDNSYEYSPESQTNINYTEIKQVNIDNSRTISVNVTNVNSVVNNINFYAPNATGKATVVVEDLKGKSVLTDKPPAGNIYKSFNIWINNGGITNIENAAVNFQVEKSWLKANGIDKSCIILNMYSKGKWVEVPVTMIGEDNKYVYFSAKVSGYSTFAITARPVTVNTVLEKQIVNNTIVVNNTTAPVEDISNKAEIIRLLEYIIELLR
ncbi:MAG: PGF-pre-PGF domain-containing protein [Methanosarcina sp.]